VRLLALLLAFSCAGPVFAGDPPITGSPDGDAPPLTEPAPSPAPEAAGELDVVKLANGREFRGTIVEDDPARVVLELVGEGGGVSRITIPRAQISTVERGSGRAPVRTAETLRDAWFLLRSGGEIVGTRREVLRAVRLDGAAGFRLEEIVLQLPQGRRVPAARLERVEETDARFIPRRLTFRESAEPGGEGDLPRFDRVVSGSVENDVWTATWKRGVEEGTTRLSLPPETRSVLGLRELLLRGERVAGLAKTQVLDVAEGGLVPVEVGFASLADGPDGTDEMHWVVGGVRRILTLRGNDIEADALAEGVSALPTTEAQARAVEAAARQGAKNPAVREVVLAEAGLVLPLPGPDWSAERPLASGLDAGRRVVARLSSRVLLANARVEWDPEGLAPGREAHELEGEIIDRLRAWCPDLTVTEPRRPVAHLSGAWRMGLTGTLRDTRVETVLLVVPRGRGVTLVLLACPESAWEQGRAAAERLVAGARPL
jgi:hypothetical protein